MSNIQEKIQEKKLKAHKRKPKHARRNRYLKMVYGFMAIVLLTFLSPLFLPRDRNAEVKDSNQSIVDTAQIELLKTYYNPKTKTLKSEFYVGNKENVDDVSSAKELTNIKYNVQSVPLNGDQKNLKTKLKKYNDNYFEVVTTGVEDNYKIIRYDIVPELINKKLESQMNKDVFIKLYKQQKATIKTNEDLTPNMVDMKKNYTGFIVASYKKSIVKLQKDIQKSEGTIKQDREVISKLEIKKADALGDAADEIDDQIEEANQDISTQKASISNSNKAIKEYKEKIKKVES